MSSFAPLQPKRAKTPSTGRQSIPTLQPARDFEPPQPTPTSEQSPTSEQQQPAHFSLAHIPFTRPKTNQTGLPDRLKAGIESLSGMFLDDVKVHYHSSKPAEVQALAYTQGTDIHVRAGQEKHLAHEAWHVAQQKQGRVQPRFHTKRGDVINDDEQLEQEAHIMSARATETGRRLPPQFIPQRQQNGLGLEILHKNTVLGAPLSSKIIQRMVDDAVKQYVARVPLQRGETIDTYKARIMDDINSLYDDPNYWRTHEKEIDRYLKTQFSRPTPYPTTPPTTPPAVKPGPLRSTHSFSTRPPKGGSPSGPGTSVVPSRPITIPVASPSLGPGATVAPFLPSTTPVTGGPIPGTTALSVPAPIPVNKGIIDQVLGQWDNSTYPLEKATVSAENESITGLKVGGTQYFIYVYFPSDPSLQDRNPQKIEKDRKIQRAIQDTGLEPVRFSSEDRADYIVKATNNLLKRSTNPKTPQKSAKPFAGKESTIEKNFREAWESRRQREPNANDFVLVKELGLARENKQNKSKEEGVSNYYADYVHEATRTIFELDGAEQSTGGIRVTMHITPVHQQQDFKKERTFQKRGFVIRRYGGRELYKPPLAQQAVEDAFNFLKKRIQEQGNKKP